MFFVLSVCLSSLLEREREKRDRAPISAIRVLGSGLLGLFAVSICSIRDKKDLKPQTTEHRRGDYPLLLFSLSTIILTFSVFRLCASHSVDASTNV